MSKISTFLFKNFNLTYFNLRFLKKYLTVICIICMEYLSFNLLCLTLIKAIKNTFSHILHFISFGCIYSDNCFKYTHSSNTIFTNKISNTFLMLSNISPYGNFPIGTMCHLKLLVNCVCFFQKDIYSVCLVMGKNPSNINKISYGYGIGELNFSSSCLQCP